MHKTLLILLISILCSACASISRGITEGVLSSKNQDLVDERECNIRGTKFDGLDSSFNTQGKSPTLKVLMVHGIGEHLPGYSTRMAENLATALNLNVGSARFKEIDIVAGRFPNENLGKLRIDRYINQEESQEMLFYELTWSPIAKKEKDILAYDNSGEHSFRRANINNIMKPYMNSHVSDPLIYLGASQEKIQVSVITSICWMMSRDWKEIDEHTQGRCVAEHTKYNKVLDDEFAFITHSMGSRIVTDSFQALIQYLDNELQTNCRYYNLAVIILK